MCLLLGLRFLRESPNTSNTNPTPTHTPWLSILLNLTINVDPGSTNLLRGRLCLLDTSGKCIMLTWIP